jgi:hypothetical protein
MDKGGMSGKMGEGGGRGQTEKEGNEWKRGKIKRNPLRTPKTA